MAIMEHDNSMLQLVEFYQISRRNSKGFCVYRGGSIVGIWGCNVIGGRKDGVSCEFAIYEPTSDLA